eukprot:GHVL01008200.1.p1 GENE.GHVL01008200.1~~GHVL01008200.1.p1  ORF type:complete len:738 (+),score=229.85 GHVL01008200.1:123-2216(+)
MSIQSLYMLLKILNIYKNNELINKIWLYIIKKIDDFNSKDYARILYFLYKNPQNIYINEYKNSQNIYINEYKNSQNIYINEYKNSQNIYINEYIINSFLKYKYDIYPEEISTICNTCIKLKIKNNKLYIFLLKHILLCYKNNYIFTNQMIACIIQTYGQIKNINFENNFYNFIFDKIQNNVFLIGELCMIINGFSYIITSTKIGQESILSENGKSTKKSIIEQLNKMFHERIIDSKNFTVISTGLKRLQWLTEDSNLKAEWMMCYLRICEDLEKNGKNWPLVDLSAISTVLRSIRPLPMAVQDSFVRSCSFNKKDASLRHLSELSVGFVTLNIRCLDLWTELMESVFLNINNKDNIYNNKDKYNNYSVLIYSIRRLQDDSQITDFGIINRAAVLNENAVKMCNSWLVRMSNSLSGLDITNFTDSNLVNIIYSLVRPNKKLTSTWFSLEKDNISYEITSSSIITPLIIEARKRLSSMDDRLIALLISAMGTVPLDCASVSSDCASVSSDWASVSDEFETVIDTLNSQEGLKITSLQHCVMIVVALRDFLCLRPHKMKDPIFLTMLTNLSENIMDSIQSSQPKGLQPYTATVLIDSFEKLNFYPHIFDELFFFCKKNIYLFNSKDACVLLHEMSLLRHRDEDLIQKIIQVSYIYIYILFLFYIYIYKLLYMINYIYIYIFRKYSLLIHLLKYFGYLYIH